MESLLGTLSNKICESSLIQAGDDLIQGVDSGQYSGILLYFSITF